MSLLCLIYVDINLMHVRLGDVQNGQRYSLSSRLSGRSNWPTRSSAVCHTKVVNT